MSLEIVLDRADRIYKPGEIVSGHVVVTASGGFSHNGISMQISGQVSLQLSAKSVGLFEAFYNSLKPITLMDYTVEIQKPGKLKDGATELPFEFKLEPLSGQELFETYHGVYVNIAYNLKCDAAKTFFGKNLQKNLEFIVHLPGKNPNVKPTAEDFLLTPESLENVRKGAMSNIPKFRIKGKIDTTACYINKPFTGSLIVEECDAPIKTIELQLVRVETIGCADGFAKEATEIQNIQIAEGDIHRNLEIPMNMIFPRQFTCPSLVARTFKVDFEVNLVVMFPDGRLITEKFPIKLIRA
jgi:hypothetical protein